MADDWYRGLDEKRICGAVLLDFIAAFDLIDHKLLLEKFRFYRFRPSVIAWMESYLDNRSQRVFFQWKLFGQKGNRMWYSTRKRFRTAVVLQMIYIWC